VKADALVVVVFAGRKKLFRLGKPGAVVHPHDKILPFSPLGKF